MPIANTTPTALDAEKARLAEEILRPQHVFYDVAAAFATLSEAGKKQFEELKTKKDADRARLMALPLPELQAMRANQIEQAKAQEVARLEAEKRRKAAAEQKEAQKEAAKFYNQTSANADFSYWATMDYWNFDEALALLLGKDPRVLTRAAMKRELTPEFSLLSLSQPQRPKSEFLRRYEDLRSVAERAAAMKPSQLRPLDVLLWTHRSGAITPPAELTNVISERVQRSQPKPLSTASDAHPATVNVPESTGTIAASAPADINTLIAHARESKGSGKKWPPALLSQLRDLKASMGTAALAKAIGISDRRIRQLLEESPDNKVRTKNPYAQLMR